LPILSEGRLSRFLVVALEPRVLEFVELLHLTHDYTLQEQLDLQWPRYGRIPYPARLGQTKEGDPWGGEIICGNDPFLVARLVDDLSVERDA
jgi:hypothetical protein